MRPFYLPREFPQNFVTIVYIHPKANGSTALELIYSTVQKLQAVSPDAPNLILGDFNHCSLRIAYRTCLQRGKVDTRQVKVWSEEASLALQGCLDCTLWEEFVQSSRDIDELTEVVSSWVAYCEDTVIPKKVVKIYPNNKPCVRKQLKRLVEKEKASIQTK